MIFIHELYTLNNINTSLLYSLLLFYLILKYFCIFIPQFFTYDKLICKPIKSSLRIALLITWGRERVIFNSQVKSLSHFSLSKEL